MTTVERYLLTQIAGGLGIAALVLIPLFSFLDLLDQLDDVGKGFYQTQDAFLYTAFLIPRRFIQLTPFIALLGNVIGLGRLAVNRELTAMRSAGMSAARISGASLRAGLILLILIYALDMTLAPDLQQKALAHRSEALGQNTELGKSLGIWTRDSTHLLRLGAAPQAGSTGEIEILRVANGALEEYIHAAGAETGSPDQWVLHEVTRKTLRGAHVSTEHADSLPWRPFVKPDQISTLSLPAESLAPVELYRNVLYLRDTGQKSDAYALAFWRKLGLGLVTIAMLLLSVPFALGSVRTGIGGRLILAAFTGMSVYLLDQIAANAGLLYQLNPILVALAPGLLLIWAARVMLNRFA